VEADVARAAGAPRVHDEWDDNVVAELAMDFGAPDALVAMRQAPVVVTREYRMARQAIMPMEGKGCLARWDSRLDQLELWTSTQVPHLIRDALCQCLGLQERQVRVIAPDVGGGFGYKSVLHPEEVLVAFLARRLGRPVRWIEDRREHLSAAANTREQVYRMTAFADRDGRLRGLEADVTVDAGAYSVFPFTNTLDAGMALGNMTGPYRIAAYRGRARAVATNKPPVTPYRGVARPGVAFATEMLLDALAQEVGRDPAEIRALNLVRPQDMPHTTVTGKEFDGGDYPEALRRAGAMLAGRGETPPDGRLTGTGLACYVEQTGFGTAMAVRSRLSMIPGPEQSHVRLLADGGLEIRIGMHSHGQGMETTMAQIACEVLGIPLDRIALVHGDTALTPYSTGTYASRAIVMAGGAVAGACRTLGERLRTLGAGLLQCAADQARLEDGAVLGPAGRVPVAEIARAWHQAPHTLPVLPDGQTLDVAFGYQPGSELGVYSYGAHAARVAVDVETGAVEVLDYVVVEDCGTMVNPMIVDGQSIGGVIQGIGTALFEEAPFDAAGQPLATTLADYVLPGAAESPDIAIAHMCTPSPHTTFGVKGVGEGGIIPAAAAICNAVNDALRGRGVELRETPMSPRRIVAALLAGPAAR
ncbi:MAG: xanthine dehydrogenase family protein molybdopterin-binding subunit, partial [Rhodospirillaceae bacterium]